jgi:hypothetical protein
MTLGNSQKLSSNQMRNFGWINVRCVERLFEMDWYIKKEVVKARIDSLNGMVSNTRYISREVFKNARLSHMQVFDDDRPGIVGFTFLNGEVIWLEMTDVGQGNAPTGINPTI